MSKLTQLLRNSTTRRLFQIFCVIIFLVAISIMFAVKKQQTIRSVHLLQNVLLRQSDDPECLPKSYVILENVTSYQQLWVRCNLSYIQRLVYYNQVVALNCKKMLASNISVKWPEDRVRQVYLNPEDHLRISQVQNSRSFITTIFLEYLGPPFHSNWSFSDPLTLNSFVESKYYKWKGINPVCEWTRAFVSYNGDDLCFNSSFAVSNKKKVSIK